MISLASPRQIAGKIRSAHNARVCKHCQRELPPTGVLAFGLSGSDARWYPDEETARQHTIGARILFPVRERDVDTDEVLAFLEQGREALEDLVEYIEQQRMERRVAREMREDDAGYRTGPYPCADCGWLKHRPADRCERCGDEPCPVGISPHDYNRGYGYRD